MLFFFFGREVFYKNIKSSQEILFGFGLFFYHIESSLLSEGFFFFFFFNNLIIESVLVK